MNTKLKILHLEDSISDAGLIKRVLQKGNFDFELLLIDSKDGFVAALEEFIPDLILSDHSLPSFNSHEALSIYNERQLKIPFILITSNVSEEFAVDVIKRGADDYILKDRLERLPSAISNALEKYQLEREKHIFLLELNKSERHYRSLIKNGADLLVVLTEEGKVKFVSPSIHRVLGFTEEESLTFSLFELLHPDDQDINRSRFSKCLKKPGVPISGFEARIKSIKGEWLWIEATMTNLLLDPALNAIVVNFHNITDRVLAEEKITASEEMYRSFFESSMDGIFLTLIDGSILTANPAACKMFQMTEEEICAAGRDGVVDKDDPRLEIALRERQLTGRFKIELTLIRKDGTKFPGEVSSVKLQNNSKSNLTSMIIRDNSERNLAEQKIILLNRLYSFTSQINQIIVRVGEDQSLFDEACRVAVEYGKFKMAWIGVVYPEKKGIELVASWGSTPLQQEFFSNYTYETGGPIDKVVNGLDYAIIADISAEGKARLGVIMNPAGFNSVIVLPIKIGPDLIATFNIYSTEINFFDDQEIDLLKEITADISFALEVFEKNKLKAEVDQRLLQSEAKLSKAQSIAKLGYWKLDLNEKTFFWSDETYRIWGRTRETFKPSLDLLIEAIHPEDREFFISEQSLSSAGLKNLEIEYRIILPDQSVKWVNDIGHLVKADSQEDLIFEGTVQDITARKVVDEELKKAESLYKQIVETAQEGIWLVDNKGKTTFVNKKMCQMLEYSEEEIMGSELFEYMDKEGKQMAINAIANERKGIASHGDFKYITKSGSEVWTTISANPFFDSKGNYSGSLAMFSNITEKKTLQQSLNKAIVLAKMGTYEIDLLNKKVFWSAMTKEILEVPKDFVPEMDIGISFYKEGYNRDAIAEAFRSAIEEMESFDLELEIISAKGNSKWVRVMGEAECHEGRCVRLFGSFQDIGKIKYAELEILKAYEEKNVIIESIDDAFFAVDRNWIIIYWNSKAEKISGKRKEDVLNKNLWEIYPEIIGTTSWSNYHASVADNTARHFEAYFATMNIWLEVSAYPSVKGLSVFFKDITERKLSEKMLIGLNEDLQKYADELLISNKGLEQFSYIISHNLRAPVANILGLTEILQSGENDPVTSSILFGDLVTNAQRLDEVIMDLNDILKVKGVLNELKEKVLITDLLKTIKYSIQNMIEEDNVTISLSGVQVDEIYTLKSYIHSIFLNLVTNSIKYRRPDQVLQIEIESRAEKGMLTIIYRDNGRGIDMDKNRDKVFGLYKRFHLDIEGKGIGLFMVKTQTEILGGKVNLQSQVDKGVEFTFEFVV